MSVNAIIWFLVIEFVLFAVLMLALYGIRKFVSDGEVQKWGSLILIVVIGAVMLLKLLGFVGVM